MPRRTIWLHAVAALPLTALLVSLATLQATAAYAADESAALGPAPAKNTASELAADEVLGRARDAATRDAWREVLDLTWPLVSREPGNSPARELLAQAYDKLGRADYARQTRDARQKLPIEAWSDIIGHSRSAWSLARRPVEGLKVYGRAGIGWDSNPARAPENFSQAYLQTHGVSPANNVTPASVHASAAGWLGIGGEFYRPLSPGYGFYVDADFGGSQYFSGGQGDQSSLMLGLGLASYDDQSGLRVGLRGQSGHYGYSLGTTDNLRVSGLGLGVDYGRRLGQGWSLSTGFGVDEYHYQDVPGGDFRRVEVYGALTRQFAGAWHPSIQFGLSALHDGALHEGLNTAGLMTGPDRREIGWTLSTNLQPAPKWRLLAGFGAANRHELSPNWSSLLIAYPTQTRLQGLIGVTYQWSQQCSLQGRLGKTKVNSDATLYAYNKFDLYLGVACWLN